MEWNGKKGERSVVPAPQAVVNERVEWELREEMCHQHTPTNKQQMIPQRLMHWRVFQNTLQITGRYVFLKIYAIPSLSPSF